MLQCHHLLSSHFPFPLSNPHNPPLTHLPTSPCLNFLHKLKLKPTSLHPLSATTGPWLAQAPEPEDGPIELPPIFATDDDPSTLQVATSVLLTGAISVFLFRSLRRRARRAKQLKFRSSGVKKSLKEEALESLKAMSPTSGEEEKSPPSAVQALLGGLSAGVIALILYKFTLTIEASLNRQTLSDNFSVRQITITIRTIINGLCYLATFVFGINSIGLVLYSGQLAFNSIMEDFSSDENENKDEARSSSPNPTGIDSSESNSSNREQNSNGPQ